MRSPARALGALLLPLLAAPALAGGSSTSEPFDTGNLGGWTYGPPSSFPSAGGNPGDHLRSQVDTFAPQVRTSGGASPFLGDYRAMDVTSVGADFLTYSTQFPAQRECTLILSSGSCQVYFVSDEFIPQPGTGWEEVDFEIDAASTTLPAGWAALGTCSADPDAAWNTVMTNVTEVRFFYGDPTFFYIFDIWDVGFDNPRIALSGWPWYDLGSGLAGSSGVPALAAEGFLAGGDPLTLTLTNAAPSSAAFLVAGTSDLNLAFLGGVLVPDPSTGFVAPLATDGAGELSFTATWPAGLPSGFQLYLQYWVSDAGAPSGVAASNAVVGTTP